MNIFSRIVSWQRHPRAARPSPKARVSRKKLQSLEELESRCLLNSTLISGYVYLDANNNGVFEPGETPFANSQIELLNSKNIIVGNTTTNGSGYYQFTADATIDTSPKTQTFTVPFNSAKTNQIQVGSLPQFDPALGTLTEIDVSINGQITSDIKVENRDSSAATITGTVAGNVAVSGPDFYSAFATTSQNQTFNASAFDGVLDFAGTSGKDFGAISVPGTRAFILGTATQIADYTGTGTLTIYEEAQATSGATGGGNLTASIDSSASATVTVTYRYIPENNLPPGAYTIVQVTQPAGTFPGKVSTNGVVLPGSFVNRTIPVALAFNGTSTNNNFGQVLPAGLSGYVYVDSNNNGVKESGEAGIGGVLVTLTGVDDNGNSVRLTQSTVASGANLGFYSFQNVRPGTYTITETPPAGYLAGKDSIGSQGGSVSQYVFSNVVLGCGTNGANNNFGHIIPAMVGGFVYLDNNNDGIKQSNDAGIGNATVTLTGTDINGNAVNVTQTTVTSGTWLGLYYFQNLMPGTYTITETTPAGYIDGKDTIGSQGGAVGKDVFSNVVLGMGTNGINNNFANLLPADMAIAKTVKPGSVNAGQAVTYTLTVSNLGPATANGVVVQDTLPGGETLVSASGAGWTCSQANGVITCTLSSMAAGASSVITVNVNAPPNGGVYTNTATVSSSTPDSNLSNNSSSATLIVNAISATNGSNLSIVSSPRDLTFLSKVQFLTGGSGPVASSPTAYVIGAAHSLYRYSSASGFTKLGDGIQSIKSVAEASGNVVVFAIMLDSSLFRYDPTSGWTQLGGAGTIANISAGTDASGRANVYVMTSNTAFYQYTVAAGWQLIGNPGSISSFAAADQGRVYAITADQSLFGYSNQFGWYRLTGSGFARSVSISIDALDNVTQYVVTTGGALYRHVDATGWTLVQASNVQTISSGTDALGMSDVFAIMNDGSLYESNSTSGWFNLSGPGTVSAINATDNDVVFVVTADGTFREHTGQGWMNLSSAGFAI